MLITANNAGSYGGGISIEGSNLDIFDTSIVDNISGRAAGITTANFRGNYLVTMSNTLVARNISDNDGGGMRLTGGEFFISNSTITQNQSGGSDGGIQLVGATLTLAHSTVTGNTSHLSGPQGSGGGISMQYLSSTGLPNILYLDHSIIAGNTDLSNAAPDIAFTTLSPSPAPTKLITSIYSLIGDSTGTDLVEAPLGSPDANGNLIGGPINGIIDPLLDLLADNGGPTLTHALQVGSPAVDAGDLSLQQGDPSLSEFDQRGAAFARVTGGRIDMGAYESQSPGGSLIADFDSDGDTDGFDFLTWQRSFGTTSGATLANGDATADGDVDSNDAAVWEVTFGAMLPAPITISLESEVNASKIVETQSAEAATESVISDAMTKKLMSINIPANSVLHRDGARTGQFARSDLQDVDIPIAVGNGELVDRAFAAEFGSLTFRNSKRIEWVKDLASDGKHERPSGHVRAADRLFTMLEEDDLLRLF